MSNQLERFEKLVETSARRLSEQQAGSVARYGELLHEFGQGNMSVGQYGVMAYSLYLNESVRYAGAVLSAGSDYLRSALDLISQPAVDAATKAAEDAVRSAEAAVAKPDKKGAGRKGAAEVRAHA